ncbi:MAG: D-alanyl-D-alanine carboxypeptidase family protein [Acidobacteriota bacterium]
MAIAVATGCVDQQPSLGEELSASTVGDYGASGCSTAVVLGLSRQIADEIGCEHPGAFVAFSASSSITLTSSAVLPYLEDDAAADLQSVAANHPLQINSAFRTIAQQYLLYRWYQQGRCGITAAATVGHSNHESGRAVDLSNWSSRVSNMAAYGWRHDVPGDSVHFDHTASDDIRGEDVTAFQTLWNRNNPDDPIAVDGSYGPQTEARLRAAPATGFAQGASCVTEPHAEVTAVDGPDLVPPQARAHYTIALTNYGDVAWPDTAQLAITADSSPLHDTSWQSDTVIATLGTFVPPGAVAEVSFDVTTPAVTEDTPVTQQLVVTDGTTTFGTTSLSLTVEADDPGKTDSPTSIDGDDSHDLGEMSGGCNAGGGTGAGSLALALGALLVRRRRR